MTYMKTEKNNVMVIRILGVKWTFISLSIIFLNSCINVASPEAPIVINLNIKVQQEILIKQAKAVEEAIEENAGIF